MWLDTGLALDLSGSPPTGSHMSESQALTTDVVLAGSLPPSPVEASLSSTHDIDGAASLVGSRATTTTKTSPGIVPSSMGWTSVQMAEDSGCSLPISALPQDMVLPHEVGSPPTTGALPQGPSTPTAIVPTVAQAPYNAIQVYSCQRKKRLENNVTESSPVQDFIAELIKHVGGLVPRPIPKRREKQLPTDFVLRCSTRLAMNRAGASAAVTRHIQ
jgi:hypothetical protein